MAGCPRRIPSGMRTVLCLSVENPMKGFIFWILDFGFWILDCDYELWNNLKSQIQNPKSLGFLAVYFQVGELCGAAEEA